MLRQSIQSREIYWNALNLHHKMGLHTVWSTQKVDEKSPCINHGGSELQTMGFRHLHAYFNILSTSEIMKFKRKWLRNGEELKRRKTNKQTNCSMGKKIPSGNIYWHGQQRKTSHTGNIINGYILNGNCLQLMKNMENKWWEKDMKKMTDGGLEKEEVKYCGLLLWMPSFVKKKKKGKCRKYSVRVRFRL